MVVKILDLEFLVLHNGVKVFAITSTLRALLVRNFAAMEKTITLSSCVRLHPGPSRSERVRRFQEFAKSSIVTNTPNCFPIP